MTLNEFKAWLEGYSHSWGFREGPSGEQWRKIKEKLDKVTAFEPKTTNRPYVGIGTPYVPKPYLGDQIISGGNLTVTKPEEINHRVMDSNCQDKYYC